MTVPKRDAEAPALYAEGNVKTEIIRSARKTMAIEIRSDQILVRVPLQATEGEILALIEKNDAWIRKHLKRAEASRANLQCVPKLTVAELEALADQALKVIPERVRYYAPRIGVRYGKITIRNQRTRWGSCSAKGNLNFNCLLMLAPGDVLDSVVVHELCHLKEMNHSDRFYGEVRRAFPNYDACHRWLKENGEALMSRMPE